MPTVTISGPVATGKTTIAGLIREALTSQGFAIEMSEEEISEWQRSSENLSQRVASLSRNGTITIQTQQTPFTDSSTHVRAQARQRVPAHKVLIDPLRKVMNRWAQLRKHPTNFNEMTPEKVGRELASLRYDALQKVLSSLAVQLHEDSKVDAGHGRNKLAAALASASQKTEAAARHFEEAWGICKPFMKSAALSKCPVCGEPEHEFDCR